MLVASVLVGVACGCAGLVVPGGVPGWVGALLTMVGLAALDLAGALIAQRWSAERSPLLLAGGMVVFAGLFAVYAQSLSYATLTTVTLGWIVLLQVAVVVVDHAQRRMLPPTDHLLVMVCLLVLQGYLVARSGATA